MTMDPVKNKAWLTEADCLLGLEPPHFTPEEEVLRERLRNALSPYTKANIEYGWSAKLISDASDGGTAITRALLSDATTQAVGLSVAGSIKPDALLPLLPDFLGILLWGSEIEAGRARRQIRRLPRQTLIKQINTLFPLLLDAADASRCERLLRLCDELEKTLMEQVARMAIRSSQEDVRQVAKGYLGWLTH